MCENGIYNLVEAIVKQVAKDYRKVRYSEKQDDICEKEKIERFFLSRWFYVLTGLDGEMVLDKLKAGD